MAHFTKMVSLARSDKDREKERERISEMIAPSGSDGLDYPPGCCLCLTDEVLEKMGIEEMPEVGDTIHLCVLGKVTECSEGKMGRRIELQCVEMACENEDEENETMTSEARAARRYSTRDED